MIYNICTIYVPSFLAVILDVVMSCDDTEWRIQFGPAEGRHVVGPYPSNPRGRTF